MKQEMKIPDDWKEAELIDIADNDEDIVAGPFGSNLKVSDYTTEGVPIVRLQNIERNLFINKEIKYVSKEKANELKYHSFRNGDIIMTKLGIPVGKACIVPEYFKEGIVVADVVRIRVSPKKAVKKFISYVLNSRLVSVQLQKETIGSTRPRVNLSEIRNLKITLPKNLDEQQAISKILSEVDLKLDNVERERQATERLKRGIMVKLLENKDWKFESLSNKEYFELIMGQSPPSSSYNDKQEGMPFLQGNADFGVMHPSYSKYTKTPLKIAEPKDILISVRAPVGEINLSKDIICMGRGLGAIRILKGNYLFYYYYLNHIKKEIENMGQGSTFKAITLNELKKISLPIPSLKEQEKIVSVLSTIDKKLELEQKSKDKLERFK